LTAFSIRDLPSVVRPGYLQSRTRWWKPGECSPSGCWRRRCQRSGCGNSLFLLKRWLDSSMQLCNPSAVLAPRRREPARCPEKGGTGAGRRHLGAEASPPRSTPLLHVAFFKRAALYHGVAPGTRIFLVVWLTWCTLLKTSCCRAICKWRPAQAHLMPTEAQSLPRPPPKTMWPTLHGHRPQCDPPVGCWRCTIAQVLFKRQTSPKRAWVWPDRQRGEEAGMQMQPWFCPWLFAPFRSGGAAPGSEHVQCQFALPRSQPGWPGSATMDTCVDGCRRRRR
jgi:hypothetical protein